MPLKNYEKTYLNYYRSLGAIGVRVRANKATQPSTDCNLTIKDAPVLRGLKLGMSEDEIINLFSIKKDYVIQDTDTEGVSSAVIVVDFVPTLWSVPPSFKGVKLLEFKIYFGKVFSFKFTYEPTEVKFENNRQFAQNISNTFKLPIDGWADYGIERGLRCKDFSVKVGATLNEITITDLTTEQRIKQREEEKRKLFKP